MKQLLITIAALVLVGCGPLMSIHEAAETGNIEAVKQHLDAGVDVNAKGGGGWTPLQFAAQGGHKEIVELLIAKGADVNAVVFIATRFSEPPEMTPLDYAIRGKHTEIADLLLKHGGKSKQNISIHDAAQDGNIAAIKWCLAAGVDINAKYKYYEESPLHMAVRSDGIATHSRDGSWTRDNIDDLRQHLKQTVRLLIAKGADVNAKQDDGKTPLHKAARWNSFTIRLLVEKGADVNAKDDEGQTPLDMAEGEIADLLRKHGGKTGEELKAEGN